MFLSWSPRKHIKQNFDHNLGITSLFNWYQSRFECIHTSHANYKVEVASKTIPDLNVICVMACIHCGIK